MFMTGRRRLLSMAGGESVTLFDSTVSPAVGVGDWKPYHTGYLDRAIISDTGIYLNEYLDDGTPALAYQRQTFVKYVKSLKIAPGDRIEIIVAEPRISAASTASKYIYFGTSDTLSSTGDISNQADIGPVSLTADKNSFYGTNADAISASPIMYENYSQSEFVFEAGDTPMNLCLCHHNPSGTGNTTHITKIILHRQQ